MTRAPRRRSGGGGQRSRAIQPVDLPDFLLPVRTMPGRIIDVDIVAFRTADGIEDDEAGGGTSGTRRLDGFGMTRQEQTNWCWAAVAQAVLRFQHGRSLEQREVATHHIQHNGRTLICAPPIANATNGEICDDNNACRAICNNAHILRLVLDELGSYGGALSSPLTFATVQGEINAGRPVTCRVQWKNGGGGHFIAIAGWTIDTNDNRQVHIFDPADASGTAVVERIVDFGKLLGQNGGYQQGALRGQVNFSYKVK